MDAQEIYNDHVNTLKSKLKAQEKTIEELQTALHNVIAWRDKNKYKSYPSDVFAEAQKILIKSKR